MQMSSRNLDDYLELVYRYELHHEDGLWVAFHPELPGCVAQGETPSEAVALLDDARHAWLEIALADGDPIPRPRSEALSGKMTLRMPAVLHERISKRAELEGVSINAFVNTALSLFLGEVSGAERVLEEKQSQRRVV